MKGARNKLGCGGADRRCFLRILALDVDATPRRELGGEARLLWLPSVEETLPYVDIETARERVARIDNMPILHMGRDEDHLQGKLTEEAAKNVQWKTFDDELHGFGLLPREQAGTFAPSALRLEAFESWMSFFDEHLKRSN